MQADRTKKFVGRQACLAKDLGEPAVAEALLKFHLPETVLRVDVAQAEVHIPFALGADVRCTFSIAQDLDPLGRTDEMCRVCVMWLRAECPP